MEIFPTKDEIAASVRSTAFPIGGTCLHRAAVGLRVLREHGLEPEVVFGSLTYRAGPRLCDRIAFAAPDGIGAVIDGVFVGHCWLRLGEDLIDFSVGDWHLPHWQPLGGTRIEWTAPRLPAFFWQPVSSFPAWEQRWKMEVGQCCYGPMAAGHADDARRIFMAAE